MPHVTTIICTYNRQEWLDAALMSVVRQTYKDLDIIVVDDGSDPPAQVFDDPRVRVVRQSHGGVGAARDAGLRAAGGELVAFCDDDDEWLPEHLEILVGFLVDHPEVDLVYADSLWGHGDDATVAYSMDVEWAFLTEYNYILPTDTVLRRSVALAAGGFDQSLDSHEDWDLWHRMAMAGRLWHLQETLAVRRDGPHAVLETDRWSSYCRVLAGNRERIRTAGAPPAHGLRLPPDWPPPFDSSTWHTDRRELLWCSLLRERAGHGSVGRQLLQAVARRGVDVRFPPGPDQPPPGFEQFRHPEDGVGRIGFYYHYIDRPTVIGVRPLVTYGMWESDLVPSATVREINAASSLHLVPCRQNVDVFRANGVTVPIGVLHHGVDPRRFHRLERQPRELFTFGTVGAQSPRKGTDVLLRAFEDEFSPKEAVRLLVKDSSDSRYDSNHPGVEIRREFLGGAGLLDLLGEMDAFVLPSRGEGFGLCALEAMATGLPLIATNWSGPADYLDPSDSYSLSYVLRDARGIYSNFTRYYGRWAEPDYEHLRCLMRQIFDNPEEAAERGARAAERVHAHWTWDRVAGDLCAYIDDLAG